MTDVRRIRMVVRVLLGVLLAAVVLAAGPPAAVAVGCTLLVQTVPATPGARVAAEGNIATADSTGMARLEISNVAKLAKRFHVLDTRVSEDRKVTLDRVVGNPAHCVNGEPIVVGLNTERLVRWTFLDRGGREVPDRRISVLEMKSNTGEIRMFKGKKLIKPQWVAAGRTQQTPKGLVNKEQYWSITRVVVDSAQVVNRGQQVFVPEEVLDWQIKLLFYRVEINGRDLLLGTLAGEGVELTGPNGKRIRQDFDSDGVAVLDNLPRAEYQVHVYGPGISFTRPMSVSKDQTVEIEVISDLDLWLMGATVLLVALSLLVVGRRHHILRLRGRFKGLTSRFPKTAAVVVLAVVVVVALAARPSMASELASRAGPAATADRAQNQPPTFAYYYIWFQPTSWLRAKSDYPLLGRYSSDDPVIMDRHVAMAKAAGLEGFIVSWKDEEHLSTRLETLVDIAGRRDFKLAIVYQGLDFERNTLPVQQVASDLETFAAKYAANPVFDTFGKPVVVITGTEEYAVAELDAATRNVRDTLHVLASAKSAEEYRRTAEVMDGDAYYWSSADPRPAWHRERLQEIAAAVREDDGLWLAPAAAGFDARLIGGEQVIPREGGETLRAAIESALASRPDAVAVISWNEFSENSHIEPSRRYGGQELEALADVLGGVAEVPKGVNADSVERNTGLTGWGAILALLFLTALLNFALVFRRNRRESPRTGGRGRGKHLKKQKNHKNLMENQGAPL